MIPVFMGLTVSEGPPTSLRLVVEAMRIETGLTGSFYDLWGPFFSPYFATPGSDQWERGISINYSHQTLQFYFVKLSTF